MATKTDPKEPKFLIVTNLTNQLRIVGSEDPDRADIVVQAYESVAVSPTGWLDDQNLESSVSDGTVATSRGDKRPPKIPPMPGTLVDSREINAVKEIVLAPFHGGENRVGAEDFIRMVPRNELQAGHPIDVKWLKDRQRPILNVALAWLKAWGRDDEDSKLKIAALTEQINYITQMTQ
jgi:hypothetical protein